MKHHKPKNSDSEKLVDMYRHYLSSSEEPKMEISWEVASQMGKVCMLEQPKSILDFGSGFSTVMLAYLNKHKHMKAKVTSVSSTANGLEKASAYLDKRSLKVHALVLLDSFDFKGGYDLILHDIGDMKQRAKLLPTVWEMLNPGGWIILEDMQNPKYRRLANRFLQNQHHLRDIETSKATFDKMNRRSLFTKKQTGE